MIRTRGLDDAGDMPSRLSDLENDVGMMTSAEVADHAAILGLQNQIDSVPAQQPGDWSASSGVTRILNKPATFPPAAHSHVAADILSGVFDTARIPSLVIAKTTGLQAALDAKFASPAGTALQYVRGDGVLANLPIAKRLEQYNGTTDANGLFTVTYPTPFAQTPSVQPEPPSNANQVWVKVSSTVSGFSLRLVQRAALTVLALEVLAATSTNVAGAAARVQVIEA